MLAPAGARLARSVRQGSQETLASFAPVWDNTSDGNDPECVLYLTEDPSVTINDLIARGVDPDAEIMILDGFNGGGHPREINLVSTHTVTEDDANEAADCEEIVGQTVAVIGYGCY